MTSNQSCFNSTQRIIWMFNSQWDC